MNSLLPSTWISTAQHACRVAMASVRGSMTNSLHSYQPLGSSTPTTPTTPILRRHPRTLLLSRRGKLCFAAAVLAMLCLMASVTDVQSTVRGMAAGAGSPATPTKSPLTLQSVRESVTKDEYIEAVLRNPVEGVLDPAPIRRMCDATQFQDGLVWHCGLINGGIGNVGNMWLNCVRYAIEAGATTIVLPRIGARDQDHLANLGSDDHSVDLDTLYDVDYFLEKWPEACPQMRAVRSEEDVPNLPPRDSPASPRLKANDVGHFARKKELIVDPTGWRQAFDEWLDAKVPAAKNMSAATPVRVQQHLALSNWNRRAHDADFAVAFPRLFRFPLAIRRLAAAALWHLEQRRGPDGHPRPIVSDAILFPQLILSASDSNTSLADDISSVVTSLGHGRVVRPASDDSSSAGAGFLGVHLRVAEDAAKAHWPGYEAQAPAYLAEARRANLSTVYLATGSEEHRARFRADAAAETVPLTVVTKEDLLDATELAELRSMSWDQQAIVDFEVLVHSSQFAGFVRSSFSWVIAIRRSILPEAGDAVVTKRDLQQRQRSAVDKLARRHAEELPAAAIQTAPPDGPSAPAPTLEIPVEKFRDGLSVVIGRYDAMTIEGIWP